MNYFFRCLKISSALQNWFSSSDCSFKNLLSVLIKVFFQTKNFVYFKKALKISKNTIQPLFLWYLPLHTTCTIDSKITISLRSCFYNLLATPPFHAISMKVLKFPSYPPKTHTFIECVTNCLKDHTKLLFNHQTKWTLVKEIN